MRTVVLGAGSWGTALAHALALSGKETVLWGRSAALMGHMAQCRENRRYLPGWPVAAAVRPTADIAAALRGAALVVLAIPCQRLAAFLQEHAGLFPQGAAVVCAGKGVERGSLRTMGQVVAAELGARQVRYGVLSGPSFAEGVMAGQPTAVVLGCADAALGERIQARCASPAFRVYGTTDVLGVELAGALKNVMAIAAGLADGLGFGENARAALITRGLAEMARLGEAMGARAQTFMGLAGLGDLVLTCTGDASRNRRVGLAVGRGQTLDAALAQVGGVAEGVWTTQAVQVLAQRLGVEMPICEQVHAVLFSGKSPAEAVAALMGRPLRWET
jgi:glycerol-3-phosphate dehydrogenase (NAD(P)+)